MKNLLSEHEIPVTGNLRTYSANPNRVSFGLLGHTKNRVYIEGMSLASSRGATVVIAKLIGRQPDYRGEEASSNHTRDVFHDISRSEMLRILAKADPPDQKHLSMHALEE